jgi:aminopeptidase-like protein
MSSRSTFKYPFPVSLLAKRERMHSLVEKYWKLNRTAVNPDTDKLVDYLRKEMEANVLEVKSGDECLTWRIPKHWVVRKGQLRKKDGTIIADFEWNPLYLWTHSISFVGEISHKELIANHVYTDPDRPEEIPYHYRNGYRYDAKEWGFSLPYKVVEQMNDSIYEVEIDTVLDNEGTLKVVDAFLPGEKKETIFFMAHTCHPALVSDGIACIAVAVELFHYLKTLEKRRYSYRFLFGPEYFAAAAYLANAKKVR